MTLAEYLAHQQARIDRALRHWVPEIRAAGIHSQGHAL